MRLLFLLALFGTLLLGAALRWQFAGLSLSWTFAHARHAHSHLAFFGVLFPLAWVAWRAVGARAPGQRVLLVYGTCVAVATIGFFTGGYWALSHAGSGGVLAVWLYAAWLNRARVSLVARDWIAPAPPALVLAAALIPFIAVFTSRDLSLATRIVQTFLSLLVYAVLVPAALARLEVRAPPAGVWLAASGIAAVFTGIGGSPLLGAGLVLLGAILLFQIARARLDALFVALWGVGAAGMIALGTGVLDGGAAAAIAGLHYLALGPILVSLLGRRPPLSRGLLLSFSALTSAMALFILLSGIVVEAYLIWQRAAALSGTLLVVVAAVAVARFRDAPAPKTGRAGPTSCLR